jgi:aspartyl/asparaginyl beta-hydroxylase (cupin superfamily)
MFYDETRWPWLEELRKETDNLRQEYLNLNVNTVGGWAKEVIGDIGWGMIILKLYEKWYVDPERVPTVKKITEMMPGFQTCQFSILEPRTEIPWHNAMTPKTVRAQLGLISPPGSFLDIANMESRESKEGEFILFNETYIHKARNTSDKRRVVFIFGFDADPSDPCKDLRGDYIPFSDAYVAQEKERNVDAYL